MMSHDHYQGGNYEFAMAKAPIEKAFKFKGFEDVEAGIVKWPMSVIRLRCADHILLKTLEIIDARTDSGLAEHLGSLLE